MTPNSPIAVTALGRKAKALELRRAGYPFREIAEQVGVSLGRAHQLVVEGMEDTRAEVRAHADEIRAEELARINGIMQRLYPLATAEKPDLQAVDRVLKCMERRARLLGLDAPVRVGVNAHVPAEVEGSGGGAIVSAEARVVIYLPGNGRENAGGAD